MYGWKLAAWLLATILVEISPITLLEKFKGLAERALGEDQLRDEELQLAAAPLFAHVSLIDVDPEGAGSSRACCFTLAEFCGSDLGYSRTVQTI